MANRGVPEDMMSTRHHPCPGTVSCPVHLGMFTTDRCSLLSGSTGCIRHGIELLCHMRDLIMPYMPHVSHTPCIIMAQGRLPDSPMNADDNEWVTTAHHALPCTVQCHSHGLMACNSCQSHFAMPAVDARCSGSQCNMRLGRRALMPTLWYHG